MSAPARWDETIAQAILAAVGSWYATQPPVRPRPPQRNTAVPYRLTEAAQRALQVDPRFDREDPRNRRRLPTTPCRRKR